jgi:parvulin-like peptidyl-prolyl isomerase
METLCHRYIITLACKEQGITITRGDIDREIERMATRFKLPVDQWMKMLKQERGITGDQYAEEIIWPTLALKRLAGSSIKVTPEEIKREYETMYGSQVSARLIAMDNAAEAEKVRKDAAAHAGDEEYFGRLAMAHSLDAPSAAAKGVIQPILRHGSYPEIENAAFGMKPGEVSKVIHIEKSGQYVILRKDADIPGRNIKLDQVLAGQLEVIIRDRKSRSTANQKLKALLEAAKIENVWNDPEKHKKMPDIAATVNGQPISMPEFIQACIDRHGETILEGLIGRTLIELEIKKQGLEITQADIEAEVARAALLEFRPLQDGSADVEAFKKMLAEEKHIKFEVYLQDAAWPSAALRKLSDANVKVNEEDLQKGFESNYGKRVRCLAIIMNNQRRANEVWEMARKNNNSDYFGDLASQYSIEPSSQALRGEVPPIRKNSGQPQIEQEAFKLKPGQISGVIQIPSGGQVGTNDQFVILRCEGYTEPVEVNLAQVKKDIYDDLYEKKLHIAMANAYDQIQDAATIDNFLTGTSRSPNKALPGAQEATAASRQTPNRYKQFEKK